MSRVIGCSAVALAVLLSSSAGCSPEAARTVRRYTYPPDFNYVAADNLESAMWRLARGVNRLERIMRSASDAGDYPQDEIVDLLEDMEKAAEALGPGKWPSNHPRISDNVDVLRRDIYRARIGAQNDPPEYFFAGTIAGACLYCHDSDS